MNIIADIIIKNTINDGAIMKVTMYTTNDYGEYISKPINSGVPLSGITTAIKNQNVLNNEFIGFGVAITGSSCYNLSLMKSVERHKLLKNLYSKDGLNFQIGRLSIGSSDYSAELYTYDDVDGDTSLEHFSIEKDKNYIIPIIKEILDVNPNLTLFASPWSPPAWMKTGGSIGGGYMREKYLDCYAEYIVKYIKAYETEGIKIYAITPQNEPETQQNGKMPACIWHPELEAKFIQILRKKLDENGLHTKIWCWDHNFSGANRVDWCLQEFPELQTACDGIAFHYYSGSIENTCFLKEKYPNINLHFTEGGPRLYDHYDTDWCKWTLMMIKALNNGYSSFTGWNLMLDETGGPNVGPFFCGGLVTRNSINGGLSYSGQYKAFRHFIHITPASQIYPLCFNNDKLKMFTFDGKSKLHTEGCIVENASGNTEIILVNPSTEKEQIQYFHCGNWWYIEMLPNTSATIVIEE